MKKNIISNKETALLGLLNERSMHAYQIEQEIYQRSMNYWTEISQSSIYKLLNKMEKEKMIKSEIKLTKKNVTQKIYKITGEGKKRLKEKIKEILSEPEKLTWRIDLAIANYNVLNKKESEECLKEYEKKLDELITGYGNLIDYLKKEKCPVNKLGLATRPIALFKAEKIWIKDFLKTL
ncbi:PadR family transcriptional regulator [Candidatus Dependentiae bacterium]|nr:PadR family transcriptional regulator [Candidatus Dependentiae bacterium]